MKNLSVKQMIINEVVTHPKGYLTELADVAGYTGQNKGSNFNKVLTDEKKEFDSFQGIMNVLDSIWKENSLEKMVQYSTEIDPNKKTARNMLEYLASSREFDALNNLLDRMDNCSNKESLEWAKIYRIESKYQFVEGTDNINSLIQEISNTYVTRTELEVYKKIYIHYCCYLKKDYDTMEFLLKQIQKEVEFIKNEYIKERYLIKVNEIAAYTNLFAYDNKEVAREYADWILESSATTAYKAYAYYIKGYSYLYTSYDEAVKYLNKSIELYEKINRQQDIDEINQDIEFMKVYWNKHTDCSYIENELFKKAKNGQEIQNELNKVELNPEFKLYYEGYQRKDSKKLLLSLIKFIKKNDLFLSNLPKIELLKCGYDIDVISEMVSMNIA